MSCFVFHSFSDGFCDDACRTEGCLLDGADCESGCVDDICSQIFLGWSILANVDTHNVAHDTVCYEWAPVAILFFPNSNFTPEYSQCIQWILPTDHNNDGHINFREFVHFGYVLYDNAFGEKKPKQVNCSNCVEMEYYNPRYVSDNYTAILSADQVCWSAVDWSNATYYTFNAPADGIITGVRLEWKSGGTTTSYPDHKKTYFGSGSKIHVQLVRIMDERTFYGETYYPKFDDDNDNTIHVADADYCADENKHIHGCDLLRYDMTPYVYPTEPVFEWMQPKYNVSRDMMFMITMGEPCCDQYLDDNKGMSCAEVWFLYEIIDDGNEAVEVQITTTDQGMMFC